jgi:hypothetical protein
MPTVMLSAMSVMTFSVKPASVHQQERRYDGDRHRRRGDDGAAPRVQEQEQHQRGQHNPDQQVPEHVVDGVLDELARIAHDRELRAGRQFGLDRSISARTPAAVLTGFASLRFWMEMLTAGSMPLSRATWVASSKPSRTVGDVAEPHHLPPVGMKSRSSSSSARCGTRRPRARPHRRGSVMRPDGTETFSAWISQ